eukprot:6163569-Pleurochrysis_carterae.AAC.1
MCLRRRCAAVARAECGKRAGGYSTGQDKSLAPEHVLRERCPCKEILAHGKVIGHRLKSGQPVEGEEACFGALRECATTCVCVRVEGSAQASTRLVGKECELLFTYA